MQRDESGRSSRPADADVDGTAPRLRCQILLKRAILTLAALPDPDLRFRLPPGSCLPRPEYTQAELEAQIEELKCVPGGSKNDQLLAKLRAETPPKFQPTPYDLDRYLDVLAWLTWLRNQAHGEHEVRLIVVRAFGVSYWKLTSQFKKSEPTLKRWYAAGTEAIAGRFPGDIAAIWARSPDLSAEDRFPGVRLRGG